MALLSLRRTYHQPVAETIRIDNHHYGPLPLFVEVSDFVVHTDFIGARLITHEGKPIVAAELSEKGIEKFNQIALENSGARELRDYVGLYLHFSGVRSDHMIMAFSQLSGNECWINGLSEVEANAIVNSLTPCATSEK